MDFGHYLGAEENKALLSFYENHLLQHILPFWVENGVDQEFGGYLNCFDNTTYELVSDDKYVWSQGRFVWLFSALADVYNKELYFDLARQGFEFLREHCFLENGHCAFLLNRRGDPKEYKKGSGLEVSVFADCFVILGFSRYASVSGDTVPLEIALKTFRSVISRLNENTIRTEPEPTPPGFRSHGVSMILLNVGQELLNALDKLGHESAGWVKEKTEEFYTDILETFLTDDLLVNELATATPSLKDTVLGRYINPGHTLESMWFVMHEALRLQDPAAIHKAIQVIKKTFEIGWDNEYGGLFHFTDCGGGRPSGTLGDYAGHPMIQKLSSDWDLKLWWVHSEALYATLLGYCLTGDKAIRQQNRIIHDYTFATFPHHEKRKGEWIQIRDRRGKPVRKTVALPVKDPFHITRSLLFMIQLLQKC